MLKDMLECARERSVFTMITGRSAYAASSDSPAKQRIMKMIKSERRSSQRDLARTQHFRLRLHAS